MNRFPFFKPHHVAALICLPGLMLLAPACSSNGTSATTSTKTATTASTTTGAKTMSTAAFINMAKESSCHQIRNQLYLIDNSVVFWDRIGKCPDNAHEQTLFGSTPEKVLATSHDSIAGPMVKVNDEKYRAMFDTIMAHRDTPDLGLGGKHKVQPLALK